MFTVTLSYAGLLGILMAILSIRVPLRRVALNAPWGDHNDDQLATRIRVFGNFTEYVPAILILMALLEASGASVAVLHSLGVWLLTARIIHALALRKGESTRLIKIGRAFGAFSTWLILLISAGYAVALAYL